MKKPTKSNKGNHWLFPVAVIAGVGGYLFFIFVPGQRATAELRKELTQQQQYVLESLSLPAKIAQVEKDLAKTKQYRDAWHANAPSEERVAHVYVAITQQAEESGSAIVRFEPQPAETSAYLRRLPLELAVEGSFHQLFAFLAGIEQLDAEFWIDSMHIEPVPSVPGRLRCELRLGLFAAERKISD